MSLALFSGLNTVITTGMKVPEAYAMLRNSTERITKESARREHELIHRDIESRVAWEDNQLNAPMQFDISYRHVDVEIGVTDDATDLNTLDKELDVIDVGESVYADMMYHSMNIGGFDEIDRVKDHPAIDMIDGGFQLTDGQGYTYTVRDSVRTLSSGMHYVNGFSAKPIFQHIPENYSIADVPFDFNVDIAEIQHGNKHMVGGDQHKYDPNIYVTQQFIESMGHSVRGGQADIDSVNFQINTLPKIYDLELGPRGMVSEAKLTNYSIPNNRKSVDKFFDDLDSMAHNPQYERGQAPELPHIVHNVVNHIGNSLNKVDHYDMVVNTENTQPSYTKLQRTNLEVDGVVLDYYEEPVVPELDVIPGIQGMFTDEYIAQSKDRVRQNNELSVEQDIEHNRASYHRLHDEHKIKIQPGSAPDTAEQVRDDDYDLEM